MEVDIPPESGMVTTETVASTSGSVSVQLHPLVIMNISEHWTRNKVQENSTSVVVYGALLGKLEGHHVEVTNSFELLLDEMHMVVDTEFYTTRESQCKQVYPALDVVGWYTTSGALNEKDELFNRQIQELIESPLILKLDPLQTCGEQLPIRIYESVVDNDGKVHYRQVIYALATDEAERIGVDYVARLTMSGTGQASSVTAEHLLSNYQAIQMLCTRLYLLRSYVGAVADGELPMNRAWLREISAVVSRLSHTSTDSTHAETTLDGTSDQLYRQANEVYLTSLLASLTQSLHMLYGCMTKMSQVLDRRPAFMSFTGTNSML